MTFFIESFLFIRAEDLYGQINVCGDYVLLYQNKLKYARALPEEL